MEPQDQLQKEDNFESSKLFIAPTQLPEQQQQQQQPQLSTFNQQILEEQEMDKRLNQYQQKQYQQKQDVHQQLLAQQQQQKYFQDPNKVVEISNEIVPTNTVAKTLQQNFNDWGKVNNLLDKKSFPPLHYKNFYNPGRTGPADQIMTASNSVKTLSGSNTNSAGNKQAYLAALDKHSNNDQAFQNLNHLSSNNLNRMHKSLQSGNGGNLNNIAQPQTAFQSNSNTPSTAFESATNNFARAQIGFTNGGNIGSNSAGLGYNSAITNNNQVGG